MISSKTIKKIAGLAFLFMIIEIIIVIIVTTFGLAESSDLRPNKGGLFDVLIKEIFSFPINILDKNYPFFLGKERGSLWFSIFLIYINVIIQLSIYFGIKSLWKRKDDNAAK